MISLHTVVFIPDWLLRSLTGKDYSLAQLSTLVKNIHQDSAALEDVKNSPLSIKTVYELFYLNKILFKLINKDGTYGGITQLVNSDIINSMSLDMVKNCNCSVKDFVLMAHSNMKEYATMPDHKYYETHITPEGLLIVVIKEGFLKHLTETKDNYNQFILECLKLAYNYCPTTVDKTITQLLGPYLFYNSNDNFDVLFKQSLLSSM